MSEFDQFWARYPRKVGRFVAEQKFVQARRRASLEDILNGVERYLASKPEYADWCHPKTWLSQGRWLDEPDEVQQVHQLSRGGIQLECPHTPKCLARWPCGQKQLADRQAS